MKRILAIGIILLFIGMSISSSTGFDAVEQSNTTSNGKTLYVGGSGPGNYSKIQDAIDNASDGEMVYVYNDSSPYYEDLIVYKSIKLIGEDRNSTVIAGEGKGQVVNITANSVTVSSFTIQNYKIQNNSTQVKSLIIIQSDYNSISGNILVGNASTGIFIENSQYSKISDNIIISAIRRLSNGIVLFSAKNNNISGNIIKDWSVGIWFIVYSNNNSIFRNTLTLNLWGILTGMYSINGRISLNNISSNDYGIVALNCFNYKITKNNFIGNLWGAMFGYFLLGAIPHGIVFKSLRDIRSAINWDGNYWNRPRTFPKTIVGWFALTGAVPWFNFDWHPAQEPYDIGM
jgi:parallel beta-helix repeat protein